MAQHLRQSSKVSWVNYAGLEDHPDHALVRKFGLKCPTGGGRERGVKFLDALQLFTRLVNL